MTEKSTATHRAPAGKSEEGDGKSGPATQAQTPPPPSEADIKGDVDARAAEEAEQGFLGVKVDPLPNSDHSLESGPDSPPAVSSPYERAAQYSTEPEA